MKNLFTNSLIIFIILSFASFIKEYSEANNAIFNTISIKTDSHCDTIDVNICELTQFIADDEIDTVKTIQPAIPEESEDGIKDICGIGIISLLMVILMAAFAAMDRKFKR